jgi:hypothetical protein
VSAPKNGEGTPPFEVGILFDQPRDYHDLVAFTESVGFARVRSGGVTVSPFTPVKVAGLDARQVTLTFPDRDRPAGLPKQDIWCRACVHTVTFVDWPRQSVLLIRVNGSASHSSEVPEMTSDVLSHVEFLDPNELMTPHGLVVMPVNTSDATRALVQFLEARVAGSGAEQYLSPGVAKSYKVTNRNGGLYEAQAERYVSYQVLSFNGTGFQISIVAKVKLSGTTFDFVVDEMIQIGKLPNGSLGVVARDLQLDGH